MNEITYDNIGPGIVGKLAASYRGEGEHYVGTIVGYERRHGAEPSVLVYFSFVPTETPRYPMGNSYVVLPSQWERLFLL